MCRAGDRPARGLRWGMVAFVALVAGLAAGGDADARVHRHYHHAGSSYQPPYADIVVDGNSGQVLHATNPDSPRHPASLTKIMTLYLLFEQIEAGRLKLDTRLSVSEHAASQAPTKLGLSPGQTIAVEDAVKAIVTQSANDMAVVVAEAIAGSEDDFARLMTRKAHALGMTRTVYANASGLPDEEQLTTARDQAILGRAIQDRFPRHYRYFATPSFHYHGVAMRNHNHLLGRIAGLDGIKTGYTRSSGFNLVSSVRRGNRHLVSVVLGGSSAGSRDGRMRELIEQHIAEASAQRTAPVIAETADRAGERGRSPVAAAEPAPRAPEPGAAPHGGGTRAMTIPGRPVPGSAEPIQPILVKTILVKPSVIPGAALAALVVPAPNSTAAPPLAAAPPQARPAAQPAPAAQAAAAPPPGARPGVLGVLPARLAAEPEPKPEPKPEIVASAAPVPPAPHNAARGEWTIQLGAFPDESQAKERLRAAQNMAKSLLANADGFTERVVKGSKELYRARFAGFDRDAAEAACHYFKRNDIACMTLKN